VSSTATRRPRVWKWLRSTKERWAIAFVFLASRIVLWKVGVRFDLGSIPHFMQYLDPRLLKDDLARNLVLLHSQPPLPNLGLGLALKLGPTWGPLAMWASFCAISLWSCLLVYGLSRALCISRRASLFIGLAFTLSPTLILYENWLFYALPTAALSLVVATRLARLFRRPRAVDGIILTLAATALAWTWAAFHLVWLLLVLAFAVWQLRRRSRVFLATATFAVLLTAGLYTKNAVLFGHFSGSSWTGMNLYRVATARVGRRDAVATQRAAGVSRHAEVGPFAPIAAYRDQAISKGCHRGSPRAICSPKKRGGHVNYNHIGYARLSGDYASAAQALIVAHPRAYAETVSIAVTRFWNPPSDHSFVGRNRDVIGGYSDWFTRYVYVAFGKPSGVPDATPEALDGRVTWLPLVLVSLACGAAFQRVLRGLRRKPRRVDPLLSPLLLFVCFAASTSLVEVGENERFRFTVEPLIFVLSGWALFAAFRFTRRAVRARRATRNAQLVDGDPVR